MRRYSYLWVVFLALALALPFSAMSQTNPTLTLESYSSGSRISGAPIKSYSMGADNTLIIYLDGPFTAASPEIRVDTTSGSNCSVPGPASVTAIQQSASQQPYIITFKVTSATSGVAFTMPISPEPGVASFSGDTKTFSWDIGGAAPIVAGTYLAVFQAQTASPPSTSQLVVTIAINPPITVTAPTSVTGPTTGSINTANSFTASGSTSTQSGDTVQYQFDWGDGSQSARGSGTQSKTWTAPGGPYTIKARAASVAYPSVQSGWATGPAITISNVVVQTYSLTINVNPSGAGTVTGAGTNYTQGQVVTVTATPNTGYTFSNWTEGNGIAGDAPTNTTNHITMNANHTITANFTTSTPPPGACSDPTKICLHV